MVYQKWIRIGILNLAFVALFGTVMRLKMLVDIPFLEQAFLIHAHSHFAFSGWVSHVLYVGLVVLLLPFIASSKKKKYDVLIWLNLISAFGMLIAFTIQGYKAVSITFSSLSLIVAFVFAIFYVKDSKFIPAENRFKPWAIWGLLLNVISAIGPGILAYLMASKNLNKDAQDSAIYFYLHLQYNGWFFFACVALILAMLPKDFPDLNGFLTVFVITLFPAYILSILKLNLPFKLYILGAIAAIIQLAAWIFMLLKTYPILKSYSYKNKETAWVNLFFYTAAIAFTLKFLLQLVSVVPSLSGIVFGFRPIIIAYLHLILLGTFSLFIIAYSFHKGYLKSTHLAKTASLVFFVGVLLNELVLAIQGSAWFSHSMFSYANELLLVAALTLLASATTLFASQYVKR